MALAGAVERTSFLQTSLRSLDRSRRGQGLGDEPSPCSTSGRSRTFRRRANIPVFAEMGHQDFYKTGARQNGALQQRAEGLQQRAEDIYARARSLGSLEDMHLGMPSQEHVQLLSTEMKMIRQRLDSMEKTMKKMGNSSSSSSSSSSESSSSSDDGMGKKVKKALKMEAKRRKADRKAASKGLKGLRVRTGALMMEGLQTNSGSAAMGTMTGTDMLRASVAGASIEAGKVEVCMSGKCRKYGGMEILQAVNASLPAGSGVQASACKCLGKCSSGPNLKVRPEGTSSTLHTHVKPSDAEAILWRHFGLSNKANAPPSPRFPSVAPAEKVLELVR